MQTYEQLYERSCRLANALRALGVEQGERVATLGDNGPETVELMVGTALGGYVRTALYTHNSGESNLYLLDLVEAAALIVEARHYEAIASHLPQATSVRHVLVYDGHGAGRDDRLRARAGRMPAAPIPACAGARRSARDPLLGRHHGQAEGHPAHGRGLARGGDRDGAGDAADGPR